MNLLRLLRASMAGLVEISEAREAHLAVLLLISTSRKLNNLVLVIQFDLVAPTICSKLGLGLQTWVLLRFALVEMGLHSTDQLDYPRRKYHI